MAKCDFCEGIPIEAEYVSGGIQTMEMMIGNLAAAFGDIKKNNERLENGIQLQDGNKLCFDSSAREYAVLSIEIKHCPFCGKELFAEDKGDEEHGETDS